MKQILNLIKDFFRVFSYLWYVIGLDDDIKEDRYKEISVPRLMDYFKFIHFDKQNKKVIYFSSYDVCKVFSKAFSNENVYVINEQLNNEYSKYGARIILMKNTTYEEVVKYAVLEQFKHKEPDDLDKIREDLKTNKPKKQITVNIKKQDFSNNIGPGPFYTKNPFLLVNGV